MVAGQSGPNSRPIRVTVCSIFAVRNSGAAMEAAFGNAALPASACSWRTATLTRSNPESRMRTISAASNSGTAGRLKRITFPLAAMGKRAQAKEARKLTHSRHPWPIGHPYAKMSAAEIEADIRGRAFYDFRFGTGGQEPQEIQETQEPTIQ